MPDDSPSLLNRVTALERKIRDGLTLAKLTLTGTLTGVLGRFTNLVVSGGLHVGNTSSAATGQIRAALSVIPGDTTYKSWIQNYAIETLANNGVAALLSDNLAATGIVFVINENDACLAIYELRGAINTTQEISDPIGVFSGTAGTAGTNIYWSAGNSRYELENKTGGSRNYRILFFGE